MLDPDRRTLAGRNVELAAHVDADLARLVATLRNMQAGFRSAGGGPTGKGSHSDPTFAQATSGPDPAERDLTRLDQVLRQTNVLLEEANSIRQTWIEPARFTTSERDPGCENCALHDRFEEVLHVGDVGGRLKDKKGRPIVKALGRWCEDFVIAAGVLPVDWQVVAHHDGHKVRREASEPADKLEPTVHTLDITVKALPPNDSRTDAIRTVRLALTAAHVDATVKQRKRKAVPA